MYKALLSDIDGTISDRRHRLHFLEGKKDWLAFFNESIHDPPINHAIKHIESIVTQYDKLIFLTGRPEEYRDTTNLWLSLNTKFKDYDLIMRANKDFRSDLTIKEEMLEKINENFTTDVIFEDQEELANMWRAKGLKCHLIKP